MVRGSGPVRPGQWAGFSGHQITQQNGPKPLRAWEASVPSSVLPSQQEEDWNKAETASKSLKMTEPRGGTEAAGTMILLNFPSAPDTPACTRPASSQTTPGFLAALFTVETKCYRRQFRLLCSQGPLEFTTFPPPSASLILPQTPTPEVQ
jgi:hypothetical protein